VLSAIVAVSCSGELFAAKSRLELRSDFEIKCVQLLGLDWWTRETNVANESLIENL
jgi:hypothetical protein